MIKKFRTESEVAAYKNHGAFLYVNSGLSEGKIKKMIPFQQQQKE